MIDIDQERILKLLRLAYKNDNKSEGRSALRKAHKAAKGHKTEDLIKKALQVEAPGLDELIKEAIEIIEPPPKEAEFWEAGPFQGTPGPADQGTGWWTEEPPQPRRRDAGYQTTCPYCKDRMPVDDLLQHLKDNHDKGSGRAGSSKKTAPQAKAAPSTKPWSRRQWQEIEEGKRWKFIRPKTFTHGELMVIVEANPIMGCSGFRWKYNGTDSKFYESKDAAMQAAEERFELLTVGPDIPLWVPKD